MSRYPLQSSEITVVPGRMYCWMIGSRVCLLLSGTTVIKALGVPLSIPPNTQCPSTERPRLYLRFPNFDSSISTIFPGPPIMIGCARKYSAQTSLKKLNQSMATLLDIFTSAAASVTLVCRDQRYINFRMVTKESFDLLKKLLSLALTTA